MDAGLWQRVKDVVADALEQPAADRPRWLDEACGGDGALRAEVEQLLAFEGRDESFIERPAADLHEGSGDRLLGSTVGPWLIVEDVGQGGMGTVYRARRVTGGFEQEAALKVIVAGLDGGEVLRRFRTERQILAALAHPYVARLLDGGSLPDGRPYLAMEFVSGRRIDEHCDAHKLPVAQRLELFLKVCAAVQYAHQHLVVHRDLKPGNILVQADGTPKLLDFGIAKLLGPESAEEAEATASVMRPMTPEYASPEQLKGEPATTATDVYALGVLLYELLCGRRPYDVKRRDPHSLVEAICRVEPRRPSAAVALDPGDEPADGGPDTTTAAARSAARAMTPERLRDRLEGDLDRIVLMALRKEPERRYASAEQLAADVQRHLDGRPVMAREATWRYRSGKFVRRHRTALAVAALGVIALAGGVAATVWQARVAERERARAERRFQELRRLANSVLFDYHESIAELPGSTPVRERLARDAVVYLDALAREGGDRGLQAELATAYQKIGDVQSQLHSANLGDTAGALQSYRKALALREAVLAADPSSIAARHDAWTSQVKLAEALSKGGDAAAALAAYRRALEVADPSARRDLAWSHVGIGRILMRTGDVRGSRQSFERARDGHLAVGGPRPEDNEARYERIVIQQGLAYASSALGRKEEALALYGDNLALAEAWVAAEPLSARARRVLMDAHEWVGLAREALGDDRAALAEHETALALCRKALAEDPDNVQALNDAADVFHRLAVVQSRLAQHGAAERNFEAALDHYGRVAVADPADWNVRRQIGYTHRLRGDARLRARNEAGALADHRAALALLRPLVEADPANAEKRHDMAMAMTGISRGLRASGDAAGARATLDEALPILEELHRRAPGNVWIGEDLARARDERSALGGVAGDGAL